MTDRREVRPRPWWQVRWRQFRNAPTPVVRAVVSSLSIAIVLGLVYLAYDIALTRGASLPGGDLRALAVAAFVVIVVGAGTWITYLVVPQPRRGGQPAGRSAWSAALGLFAAIPIAYIVLVIVVQVIKPLIA